MTDTAATVKITIEFFGTPRLLSGRKEVQLELPGRVSRAELVRALSEVCPALVGPTLREDRSGLQEGYVFNHNGLTFLDEADIDLQPGDSLLLLSSQAGG
ncbi:MAG: MoaD/ThiS family protein [Dehalococcoidia bacterium]